jgi:mevalonate kinase
MKTLRTLIIIGTTAAGLVCPRAVFADTTVTPPVVVGQDRDDRDLLKDLKGAPPEIQKLILSFDKTRDTYLMQQKVLLAKLHKAATDAQREAIRDQLQQNRKQFFDELKDFRTQLRTDLQGLKLNNGELKRIVDAARDAAHDGSHPKGAR